MNRRVLLYIFLCFPVLCRATDLKPWFGNEYEFEVRALLLYQNYHSIATPVRHVRQHKANDGFATLGVLYPFKRFCGEFEATVAYTRHQKGGRWDSFRLTGRYLWLDETRGDVINLTTGLLYTQVYSRALHDISAYHHGHIEGEANFAFGKKYGDLSSKDYAFRWWGVAGVGVADVSKIWFRGDAACEYKYKNKHLLRLLANTWWGMGHHNLHPNHFKGYGFIRHRSVDLGVRYGWIMERYGTLSIEYARRVFAHNYPEDTNLILFEYAVSFGSQCPYNYCQ